MPQTLAKPENPDSEKVRPRGPDGRFLPDEEPRSERGGPQAGVANPPSSAKSRKESVLVQHREAIQEIVARRRLRSLALVGSVARGEDTEDSDCDFLVGLPEDAGLWAIGGLRGELRDLLGCKVEVMPDDNHFRASKYASSMLRDAIPL